MVSKYYREGIELMIRLRMIWKESILCSLFCIGILSVAFAQHRLHFYRVESKDIGGRSKEMLTETTLGRLPIRLKEQVRPPVWSLGENSAGIYIDFQSDADTLIVRYQVAGGLNMPHMPTTGVSGVDLYLKNNRNWQWAFGNYQFKDTIQYTFAHIGTNTNGVYRLYLPLYNTVKWLEIGVSRSSSLSFLSERTKPIVVYGTSIAQGACVSRPGMAWSSIVGRALGREVINLAFSGNGKLEQPILDLLVHEDAAVFVLDCLPNLAVIPARTAHQLDSLVTHAVRFIREKHPQVPIILTGHSSAFTPGFLNKGTLAEYEKSTQVGKLTFRRLRKEGIKHLYWLDSRDIGLDINSTVDYAHPNDYGMDKIAQAYIRLLRKIWR